MFSTFIRIFNLIVSILEKKFDFKNFSKFIHATNAQNENAIFLACCESRNIDIVKRVHLDLNVNINHRRKHDQKNVLHVIFDRCSNNDVIDIIKYLLSIDIFDKYAIEKEGETALHIACKNCKELNVIQLIYNSFKDRNFGTEENPINIFQSRNEFGSTFLLSAFTRYNSNLNLLKFFLSEEEININQTNKFGQNFFLLALQCENNIEQVLKCVKYLRDKTNIDIHIHSTIKFGYERNAYDYAAHSFELVKFDRKFLFLVI